MDVFLGFIIILQKNKQLSSIICYNSISFSNPNPELNLSSLGLGKDLLRLRLEIEQLHHTLASGTYYKTRTAWLSETEAKGEKVHYIFAMCEKFYMKKLVLL